MRIVKSISFNAMDPFENKMIDHFKSYPNFSSYVKRLIQRDMEGLSSSFVQEAKSEENDDLMEQML